MTLSPPELGQGETACIVRFCVSARGRNCQFGFSAATELAPDLESTSDKFWPVPAYHASPNVPAMCSWPRTTAVDAHSVVPNSESQTVFTYRMSTSIRRAFA